MNSLPEGLILPTSEPPANLTGMIDVGDITRLWRVYNAIPRINPNSTIPRLENFFWRIWGSDTLLTSLDGEKLTGLFRGISEDRDLGGFFRDGVRQVQTREKSGTAQTPAPIHGNGQTGPTRLPSILKKHNSQKNNSLKTTKSARLLLPGPDGQILTHSPSTPPSPPPVRLGRLARPMFIIGDPDEYPECESQSKSQKQKQSEPKDHSHSQIQTQTQTQKKITQFIARTRNSIKRKPTPSGGRKTRSSPTMSPTDKKDQNGNGQSRSLTSTPQTPSPASPVLSPLAAQGEVWVDLPDEVPEELTEELLSKTHTETKPIEQPPLTDTFINTLRAHMKANPVSANHGEDMAFHMDRYVYPNPPPEPRRIDIGSYRPWHRYQNRDRNESQNQPQSNNQTHTHTRNQTPQSPPMSLVEPGFRARFSGSLASSRAGTSPLAAAAAGVGNGIGSDSGSSTEVESECPESERQTGIPDPTPPVPVPGSRPVYGYRHGHGRGHGFNSNRIQTQIQRQAQAQAHGQTQTQAVNEHTFDDDDTSTIASENVAVESVTSQFPIPPSRYNRMAPASGGPSASTNGTGSSFETISTPESDSQIQSQTEGQALIPTLTQGQAQSQSEGHIQAQTQVHGQVQGQSDAQENEGQEGEEGQVRGLRMDVTFEELEELCPPVW